ncbi:zinc knuckle CX2CX4HX4C containing protein [Tanacetum coccineum]
MAGVDVDTLTMEQYLALSQENQAPGVVKPEIGGNVNFEINSQFMRELREDTFSGNKDEDAHNHIDWPQKDGWADSPQELSIHGISLKRPLSKAIQTMANHFQKWHDGMTSRNIRSSSSNDGLAALVNKLDNLGRDMKKLKESVHAIQVACQICEGPHLDKDCPLNEEVKQVEETDNLPPYGEWRQNLEDLLAKHQEESARRSIEIEVWIKKLQENAEINTRNQNASLKNLEIQIEQLTEELHSRNIKSEQAKIVIVKHDRPCSPKKLKNLHGISFLSDSQEETTNDQLPTKESNLGHFTLPCTIDNFNFYAMADLGASVNVLPRNIFKYLKLTTEMLVEMADMRKKGTTLDS